MSSDEEGQQDEMVAMESIFDKNTFQLHDGDIRFGQIKIRLDLPNPFYVSVETEADPNDEDVIVIPGVTTGNEVRYKVQYLPPLILHFTLPKNYPSQAKPNFTLSATWLHRASLSILCQKLDSVWEENKGMGILFSWTNYLQAETLTDLGIHDAYDVSWLTKPQNLSKKNPFQKRKRACTTDNSYNNTILNGSTYDDLDDDADPPPEINLSNEPAAAAGAEGQLCSSGSQSPTKPIKAQRKKKRSHKSTKKTTKFVLDQRAASDSVPRSDGKDVALVDYLLNYNDEQVRETFLQASHSCDICFTIKIGHSCVRFRCGHVFCEDCVRGFFSTNITDGTVDQVKCLAFNCKMRPSPELVKQLVGETLYDRYDQILLKRALENMSDITYCPRPKCHNPVICDPNDKCAFCSACSYTFCSLCKMVYHGVEPCRFKDADMKDVFKKYTEGSSTEKQALIKAYGEKQLKVLVENVLSEQWINKESKPCPHCKVPIEKFEGCNKVTCFKCNTYFCWLCLAQLEQGNPYFHFNDPSSQCYNNLFQDVEMDDGPANEWIGVVDDSDSSDDDLYFYDSDSDDFPYNY